MSDSSYRYRVGGTNLQSRVDEPLVSFNGVNFLPGPSGSLVLHRNQNDARMIAESGLAEALRECGHFRSLDVHANAVMEAIPALRETPADVSSVLNAVHETGLFETAEEAWSRLTRRGIDGFHTPAPARLFILTCDRPAALSRLLKSLVSQPLPDDLEGVWVVDDSREKNNIDKNKSLITQAKVDCNVSIQHFDMTQRRALINRLIGELPDNATEIEFLLERSKWGSHPTYGLARNLILLLSVGKRALVLDDDILVEAIMPPLSTASLRTVKPNERQAVFYSDSEALDHHALPSQSSPLSMMLDHLGLSIASVLTSALAGPRALAGWDGQAMSRLDSESRVLITECGSWGDPGTGSGNWIINLDDKSIRSLLELGGNLEAFLEQRASWFGYRGPVLTSYGSMSQMTGIDNSSLLPPYLPVGRGEDMLFGILTLRMHPTSVVYNEGWAIRHEPIDNRSNRGVLNPLSSHLSISSLVDWLGREPIDQWGLTAERRLYGIAEQIERLSEMQPAPLLQLVGHEKLSLASAKLDQCMKRIEQASDFSDTAGHQEWTRFLEASRNKLLEQIQTSEAEPLKFIDAEYGGLHALQEEGKRFSAALRAWPAIRDAARRQIDAG